MLAFLMREYGIIITGLVGKAMNGWDDVGGVFGVSGVWVPDFGGFVTAVEFVNAGGTIEDVRL